MNQPLLLMAHSVNVSFRQIVSEQASLSYFRMRNPFPRLFKWQTLLAVYFYFVFFFVSLRAHVQENVPAVIREMRQKVGCIPGVRV